MVADGDRLRCDAVVVAAGAWAPALLGPLGIELDLTPDPRDRRLLPPGRRAAVADRRRRAARGQGRATRSSIPPTGSRPGCTRRARRPTPTGQGSPTRSLVAATVGWARERFPGLGEPVDVQTCLYANRPDDRFAIERHGRVVAVSACSGHGFKFAPAIGERAAELVLEALS